MIDQLIEDIDTPSKRRYWDRYWKFMAVGLARQAQRRIARKLVVGQAFEADVEKFAGSFRAFRRQLQRERHSLAQRSEIQNTGTYEEYIENHKEGG